MEEHDQVQSDKEKEREKLEESEKENELGQKCKKREISSKEVNQYYKRPKHFYPGETFTYNFDHCDIDDSKKKALNKMLV